MEFMDHVKRQYSKPKGNLIIIGGHEDKENECVILKEVARRATRGRHGKRSKEGGQGKQIVLTAVASNIPEEVLPGYERIFRALGVEDIGVLEVRTPEDAHKEENVQLVKDAAVIFFTGGDQLRITGQMGVTPLFEAIFQMYIEGGTIVGTSAGAAAMSETMVIAGVSSESNEIGDLDMGAGLGLLREVVIDSHFAERGRIGRLLGAAAQNPRSLGIGIDEDTAIMVEQVESFRVIGSGAVYVVEGRFISYSNLSEKRPEGVLSIYDVQLHVLGDGDIFNLAERRPIVPVVNERNERNEPQRE
jgi:cyanophycinase